MRHLAGVLLVVSAALSLAASPEEADWCGPWQWLDGRPGADSWNDASSRDGLVVAVGDRGAIALSADGVDWRRVDSPVTTDLCSVLWGPRGLVAVGEDGVVLTSRDALHWVRRPTPTAWDLCGVADNGTEYLVVGQGHTVLASRDGIAWELRPEPELGLGSVTWGRGKWVGVGGGCPSFWSDDRHGRIFISEDGYSWRQVAFDPLQWLEKVVWTGKEFVAVGGYSISVRFQWQSSSLVVVSPDGESWVEEEAPPTRLLRNATVDSSDRVWAVGIDGGVVARHEAGVWRRVTTGMKANLYAAAPLGQRLVVLGELGSVARIDPAGSVEPVFPSSEVGFHDGCDLGDGRLLLAGDHWRVVLREADGTFTEVFAGGTEWDPPMLGVACGIPGAVAVGRWGVAFFAASPDEWREVPLPVSQMLLAVEWNGSSFLAVGTGGAILSSLDGEHWQIEASGVETELHGITWDGNAWIVVGDRGTVLRSTATGGWQMEPTPTDRSLKAVSVGPDGTEVTVGADVVLARSGGTWLEGEGLPHAGFSHSSYRTVVWVGDRFVAGGGRWDYWPSQFEWYPGPPDFFGSTVTASSRDGLRWTAERAPTPMGLLGAVPSQDGALLVGGAGAVLDGGCARPLDDLRPERWLVPAVASVDGLAGTAWRSELALATTGDEPLRIDLYLLPREDRPSPLRARSFELAPGETRVLADVVGGLFGWPGGAGSLLVTADRWLSVFSETATRSGDGRLGQAIPAIPEGRLLEAGEVGFLVPIRVGSFRTNIGLSNASPVAATAVLALHDTLGRPISSEAALIPPWGSRQLGPVTIGAGSNLGWASLEVVSGQGIGAYASVVDNATGDPALVSVALPSDGSVVVPAAAHLPGALDTHWRSQLAMLAVAPQGALVGVELVERFPSGATAMPVTAASRDGRSSTLLEDVLGGVGRPVTGWLRLEPRGGELVVSSRTFTTSGRGTVGQGVPVLSERDWLRAGETAVITPLPVVYPGLGAPRTNLGVVSSATVPILIQLRLRNESGDLLIDRELELGPLGSIQLNRVLDSVEVAAPGWATAELISWSPGARFAAYASVVDELTGDPIFLLAVAPDGAQLRSGR